MGAHPPTHPQAPCSDVGGVQHGIDAFRLEPRHVYAREASLLGLRHLGRLRLTGEEGGGEGEGAWRQGMGGGVGWRSVGGVGGTGSTLLISDDWWDNS